MYFYLLLLAFIEFLGKIPLSFIGHFFESFRKGTPIFYCWLFCILDEANFSLHFISHTFLQFNNLFFEKSDLTLYSTLFFRLYETFSHVFIPHPLLLTFFRFERRFFWQLTNCLPKNPSILYWAFFWDLTTAFLAITNSLHSQTRTAKWQPKKGMTIPLKNQCMSCPISMVSVLTLTGGYKLFSGLLYWSMISVSGGWNAMYETY